MQKLFLLDIFQRPSKAVEENLFSQKDKKTEWQQDESQILKSFQDQIIVKLEFNELRTVYQSNEDKFKLEFILLQDGTTLEEYILQEFGNSKKNTFIEIQCQLNYQDLKSFSQNVVQNFQLIHQNEQQAIINNQENLRVWIYFKKINQIEYAQITFLEQDIGQNSSQELEKKLKYQESLMVQISHDFKTPLNGIGSILDLMISQYKDKSLQYYLNIISKNAKILLIMINDLLDFSRIKNEQLKINKSEFLLNDFLLETLELFKIQAEQKKIVLDCEIQCKSKIIYSDSNRLKQILYNLISNALKYTEQGFITIKVIEMNSMLLFSVKDTGCGIPKQVLSKLFQMYATFDHKAGTNTHGVGLGLVICQRLVGLLGPHKNINVETQVGKGSEFSFSIFYKLQENCSRGRYVSISLIKKDEGSPEIDNSLVYYINLLNIQSLSNPFLLFKRKSKSKSKFQMDNDQVFENSEYSLGDSYHKNMNQVQYYDIRGKQTKKILFVDDEVFNSLTFQIMMKRYKVEIDIAYQGQQALDLITQNKNKYNYVFLDLMMPVMDGYQTAKKLISMMDNNIINKMKLIAISGFDDDKERNECYEIGFDAFLPKPFQISGVLALLSI